MGCEANMITEIASTMRQICQEIRAEELVGNVFEAMERLGTEVAETNEAVFQLGKAHTLASIRRFKGL